MSLKTWSVYLSGEIHTDWRERIQKGVSDANLPITFHSPVTDHDASDNCGVGYTRCRGEQLLERPQGCTNERYTHPNTH